MNRSFYQRSVLDVARDLIGYTVWSRLGGETTAGRIVEAEAYGDASDLASHAARLKRGRVLSMSGSPGFTYVYRSHGLHAMLNVVAEPAGSTAAVLIRALEPVCGVEVMQRRRGFSALEALCSGPGKLCQALGISLNDHGIDLVTSDILWIARGESPYSISVSGRIGIRLDVDRPWRFFEADSRFVSAHRRGTVLAPANGTIRGRP